MPKTKSQILLESYFDEKQLKDWKAYRHFFVVIENQGVYQLKDGSSIVQWHECGQEVAYNVWAVEYGTGDSTDQYSSLLTQLVFLTSKEPSDILDIACTEGRWWNNGRGCPPMTGHLADPEGKVPRAYRQ